MVTLPLHSTEQDDQRVSMKVISNRWWSSAF